MMRYQHCIFDLYGTLVDIHTEETKPLLWEKMAFWYTRHGAFYPPQALQRAYFRTVQQMERENGALHASHLYGYEAHPEIQIDKVFQKLFWQKSVDPGPELLMATARLFRQSSTEFIRLYEGAEELLRSLHENGQKVWLLSNAQHLFTMYELGMLGIRVLFDGIYLSSDYGCKKPDRRFFAVLLNERGIDPNTAIMIGNDGLCDIQGAKAAGLSTLYVHSDLSPAGPLPVADYVLPAVDLNLVRTILTNKG